MLTSSQKLKEIRQKLHQINAHALFIPMTDAFLNEYISPQDERIKWLSDFSGSSGFAIVTLTNAVIFTDGRYTLQLKQQVNNQLFDTLDFAQQNDWISNFIHKGETIVYDPWHFSAADINKWTEKFSKINVILHALEQNIIDNVWNDQPNHEMLPAFLHPIQYSGMPYLQKMTLILKKIDEYDCCHFLFGSSESLNWLLNIRGRDLEHTPIKNMYGILHNDNTIDIFTHLDSITENIQNAFDEHVHFHDLSKMAEMFSQFKSFGTIAYDSKSTPSGLLNYIQDLDKRDINDPCTLLKSIKNKTEQKGFYDCHIRDGVAMVQFMHWLQTITHETNEIEIADVLAGFRQQQSLFHSLSFATIAGYGPNGAIVHYHATPHTNKKISKDNLLLLDSGAQYFDGTTDITRTISIGNPSEIHKNAYTRVLKGHIAIAKIIFPSGTTGGQLDILARQYLWEIGINYPHGTGHGVGSFLNVHEGPQRISPYGFSQPLLEGMILSNEPGYYQENDFGVRIENLIITQKHHQYPNYLCFNNLTCVPYDNKLIDQNLLTPIEIEWINQYHKNVFTSLEPHLDKTISKWLEKITAPLQT